MLSDFKITPTRDMQKRFYKRDPLEEAWNRYLPPLNPSSRHKASNSAASADSQPVMPDGAHDGLVSPENPASARVHDVMTGWNTLREDSRENEGLASSDGDVEIRK